MSNILSILVTYNFEPWLDKCLGSLLASTVENDILVIDNNSADKTVSLIKSNYPSVFLMENKVNLGFGKANNLGLTYAVDKEYNFVFLINQDAWIDSNCLQEMLQNAPKQYGLLSPYHYDGSGQALDIGFSQYISKGEIDTDSIEVPFVNAAFWLIPIDTIKNIGGFSSIFYHYGEDSDYSNRLRYFNYKMIVIKNAKAYHDRKNRPISAGRFYRSEFVFHLTEYCNINYSFFSSLGKGIGGSLKKSIRALTALDFDKAKHYLLIAIKLTMKSRQVLQTRKYNKKLGQKII